ncbi:periplasmic heavy metal sensor [Roseobacter sp. YSTF-M11]|uniref:Periplasmic heavy metal sensor n=1 Tax=Roseobacter insulae TaxID=2859783 RepID=A0A9X1K0R4_9RHOB|nr:periplasmic heavy metal sensor [Roseobacter insulae]MBW4708464.1 periplasmic heavy metal sensor [Roseobacter insulae]
MQTDTDRKPGASRRFKILLGVSLALNLAVAGLIVGTMIRHGEAGRAGFRTAGLGAYGLPYMIALPNREKRAVIRAVRQNGATGVPDRATRRALYSDVLTALRASPFNPEQLSAAVTRQATTSIAVQKSALEAWLRVVGQMTDAERAAYARDVQDVLRRGPRRRN